MYLLSHKIGNHFLMGWSEAGVTLMAILETKELSAVIIPPAALLPKLTRLDSGHKDFYCAGPVHLFPDDVLHLSYGPEAEGKIGVNP